MSCFHLFIAIARTSKKEQTLDTLIDEEALLLAKYLRGENNSWIPRVPSFPFPTVLECS
jgi:hypothetical protein